MHKNTLARANARIPEVMRKMQKSREDLEKLDDHIRKSAGIIKPGFVKSWAAKITNALAPDWLINKLPSSVSESISELIAEEMNPLEHIGTLMERYCVAHQESIKQALEIGFDQVEAISQIKDYLKKAEEEKYDALTLMQYLDEQTGTTTDDSIMRMMTSSDLMTDEERELSRRQLLEAIRENLANMEELLKLQGRAVNVELAVLRKAQVQTYAYASLYPPANAIRNCAKVTAGSDQTMYAAKSILAETFSLSANVMVQAMDALQKSSGYSLVAGDFKDVIKGECKRVQNKLEEYKEHELRSLPPAESPNRLLSEAIDITAKQTA